MPSLAPAQAAIVQDEPPWLGRPAQVLLAVIIALGLARVLLAASIGLTDDEAYYPRGGRSPRRWATDHPPMVAWMTAAGGGRHAARHPPVRGAHRAAGPPDPVALGAHPVRLDSRGAPCSCTRHAAHGGRRRDHHARHRVRSVLGACRVGARRASDVAQRQLVAGGRPVCRSRTAVQVHQSVRWGRHSAVAGLGAGQSALAEELAAVGRWRNRVLVDLAGGGLERAARMGILRQAVRPGRARAGLDADLSCRVDRRICGPGKPLDRVARAGWIGARCLPGRAGTRCPTFCS